MKRLLLAGLALQLCALPALAQSSTGTAPSSMPPASGMPSPATSPGTRPMTGATTYSTTTPSTTMPAATTSGERRGANSFTEAQARRRLEKNGYKQVSGLAKGSDGIWRGTATKNGNSVQVSVDYKGGISMN